MIIHYRLITALCCAALAFVISGCGDSSVDIDGPSAAGKPVIVTSVYPVADLLRQLVADHAEVHTLIKPGASPHGAELSPRSLTRLRDAKLVVKVGLGMDDQLIASALASAPADVAQVSFAKLAGIAADADHVEHQVGHDDDHDHALGPNPHLWLDPPLVRSFIAKLQPTLIAALPEHEQNITANVRRVLAELDALDAEYKASLAAVPNKQLVTFHNAFDRPAERYGLKVAAHLTPIELRPGGEITPRRLREAVQTIRSLKLHAIYTEPQFPPDMVNAIADETGVRVLTLDPLGAPDAPGYETYFAMMRSNLATLVKGQSLVDDDKPAS